jgi:hypothetical protein
VHDMASNSGINVRSVEIINLRTLIIQESVCPVGPKNVSIRPENTMC